MKRHLPLLTGIALFCLLLTGLVMAQQNPAGVTATPFSDRVNVRANTFVESDKVGELSSGMTYDVIGRSELYPWLLLADTSTGDTVGWVYETLVQVNGNLNNVPFSDTIVGVPTPTINPSPGTGAASSQGGVSAVATGTPAPAQQQVTETPAFNVAGTVQGEINVRYGPGIDYPRVGVARPGERFQITGYHTQIPWVQIRYDASPTGTAWIAQSLLEIEGNIFSTQAINRVVNLPTLTPTPSVIQSSSRIGDATPISISAEFQALGDRLWSIVLNSGFDPETSKFASLFLLDLQTGEAITFGGDIAYRGTSINKVPILTRLYGTLSAPPRQELAVDIANTMICSENAATNRLIATIGEGNEWRGTENITQFLREVGLTDTYLLAPYTIDPANPPLPPAPIPVPETAANQERANPEPYNQMTVEDMGWLLAGMYQCGYQESGPLIENFPPGTYEPRECRQMIHVMASNTVDGLLKAGVPADVRVAHKHGWVNDTHTNAGIFFTEGGDYVLVMALHSEELDAQGNRFLQFSQSLPALAETSRTVYNYYNPQNPQPAIREGFIPEAPTCNLANDPLITDLQLPTWDR
jgi:uncharacterized protein YraI